MKLNPLFGTLVFTLCFGLSAYAQDAPRDKLQVTVDRVIEIMYTEDFDEAARATALKTAVEADFSFAVIARRALGRNWGLLTEEQQPKFVDLFTDLLIETYSSGFAAEAPPTIEWTGQKELKENYMEITTEVTLDGNTFPIDYRLVRLKDGWQVYDVLVENVSLVGNYRKQFNSILIKGDVNDLLEQLETKLK
jgi:phospholipid transport system substrate-binding protein